MENKSNAGRKPLAGKAMEVQLTFRAPLEMRTKIDQRRRARDIEPPIGAMIRHLLALGIEADKQRYEDGAE